MAQEDAFRRRKLNFNEDETEILIREVTLHQDQLFGRGDTKLPPGAKNKIWLSILAKVNAVSKCTRDIGDIKKRWYDMCHRTKDKVIKLAQEALRNERAIARTPPRLRRGEEEEEEGDEPPSASLGHPPAAPGTRGGDDGSEPSTSGASQDGSAVTTSSQHAAPCQWKKPLALPLPVAWHSRQVPPMLSHQTGVQWPPVLLFTLGQNATRDSIRERPPDHQAGNTFS
eukprot:g24012.t1